MASWLKLKGVPDHNIILSPSNQSVVFATQVTLEQIRLSGSEGRHGK